MEQRSTRQSLFWFISAELVLRLVCLPLTRIKLMLSITSPPLPVCYSSLFIIFIFVFFLLLGRECWFSLHFYFYYFCLLLWSNKPLPCYCNKRMVRLWLSLISFRLCRVGLNLVTEGTPLGLLVLFNKHACFVHLINFGSFLFVIWESQNEK